MKEQLANIADNVVIKRPLTPLEYLQHPIEGSDRPNGLVDSIWTAVKMPNNKIPMRTLEDQGVRLLAAEVTDPAAYEAVKLLWEAQRPPMANPTPGQANGLVKPFPEAVYTTPDGTRKFLIIGEVEDPAKRRQTIPTPVRAVANATAQVQPVAAQQVSGGIPAGQSQQNTPGLEGRSQLDPDLQQGMLQDTLQNVREARERRVRINGNTAMLDEAINELEAQLRALEPQTVQAQQSNAQQFENFDARPAAKVNQIPSPDQYQTRYDELVAASQTRANSDSNRMFAGRAASYLKLIANEQDPLRKKEWEKGYLDMIGKIQG
jgi:hypothetical protein